MAAHRTHARVLLALDGASLGRELLATVFRRCVHLCPRLDILLINPPREPTTLLAVLLLRLEHSGVEYRIASAHGDIGEEVLRYLGRYQGISHIALADPAQIGEATRTLIELKGHRILTLSEPGPGD